MLKNIIQLIYKIIPSIQNSLLPKSQSIYVELFHILPKKIPNYDTKTLPNTKQSSGKNPSTSETKKADSKLNRLPSRRTFALTPKKRRLSTLPLLRSTIDVVGLNFSVRNGKRWIPNAITTLIPLCKILTGQPHYLK